MTCALAFEFLRETNHARLAGGREVDSRTVDETFCATEYEEIIEEARDETAAARTNDGTPDPIVVTKGEHCQSTRLSVST